MKAGKIFFLVLVAAFTAVLASAAGQIGVIQSYDAKKKTGMLTWEGTGPTGTAVPFLLDPACPVVKPGDRVYAVARSVPQPGVMDTPENSFLQNLYVTGLVASAQSPAARAPTPAPAPAPKVPASPMGVVKSFDPVQGIGIFVPDGQYAGLTFRPWPGFVFSPSAGAHLRYAQDQQFGQTILWVAPPETAAAP
jgi:hypothetical protein